MVGYLINTLSRKNSYIHYLVALCCLSFSSFAAAHHKDDAQWLQDFDAYFQAAAMMDLVPGAAYIIVSRQGVIKLGTYGYANPQRAQAVTPDTVFRIASVSKTFASTLTGLLVAEGKLNWHEPITAHAPQFRINGPTEQIHLDHILSQSTGLPAYAYDNFIEEGLEYSVILNKFRDLKPVCHPGQCYTYQNSAFSLIQQAVESVSDESYGELLDERIFTPLNMTTASVGYEDFIRITNRAQPHVKRRGQWHPTKVQPNYYRVAPAAGVNASVTDLGKWLMAQLGSRPDVLPSEVLNDVTKPRIRTRRDLKRKHWRNHIKDAHYALGWRVYDLKGKELIYHGGWVAGFRTDVAYSRDYGIGLAVVMNAEGSTVTELSTKFWGELIQHPTDTTLTQQYKPAMPKTQPRINISTRTPN